MKKCLLFLSAFICMVVYTASIEANNSVKATSKKVNSAIDNPSSYHGVRSVKKNSNDSIASSKRKVQFNKDAFNPFTKNNKK